MSKLCHLIDLRDKLQNTTESFSVVFFCKKKINSNALKNKYKNLINKLIHKGENFLCLFLNKIAPVKLEKRVFHIDYMNILTQNSNQEK